MWWRQACRALLQRTFCWKWGKWWALAIYRDAAGRGVHSLREPQVGNFAWEVFFADADGYNINFSSPTDLPEETLLSEINA